MSSFKKCDMEDCINLEFDMDIFDEYDFKDASKYLSKKYEGVDICLDCLEIDFEHASEDEMQEYINLFNHFSLDFPRYTLELNIPESITYWKNKMEKWINMWECQVTLENVLNSDKFEKLTPDDIKEIYLKIGGE